MNSPFLSPLASAVQSRASRLVLALFLAAACSTTAANRPVKHPAQIKTPPLKRIQPVKPERFELNNGLVVYLVADRELPMIDARALIRVGSRWEPADKVGLAGITGSVMRTGGTATREGDRLDDELDRLGAVVETGIGEASGGGSVSVLKEDIDQGLAILVDLLRHPAFPEDKIELERIQARDAIARRNDDPSSIADREFDRVLYGRESPYARVMEYRHVEAIQRDDLVAFHREFFQPENVILGVWGDFEAPSMRAKIESAFGSWPRGGRPTPAVPSVDPDMSARRGYYLINKEDVNQSWVMMGHVGGRRDAPDYFALEVMNQILGGGFASRLFSNVRSREGLAYTVYSSWSAGWDRAGSFMAGGHTKSESTAKILAAIQHEIKQLMDQGANEDELTRVKDGTLKGLAFASDSTAKIIRRLMDYEYYGYPADFLQRYEEGIRKVTREDIQRVARQYLKPDQFAILVLGKSADFDQPLARLGKVTEIDITIPPPTP
jgi:zinc protease